MAPKPYRAIKPMFQTGRWRIFPGDLVYVNHGPYKDQTGKVLQVYKDPRVPQVLVQGVNLRKMKIPTGKDEDEFMVVTIEAPIHYSQVSLLEPMTSREAASEGAQSKDAAVPVLEASKRWVRAKFRYLADGTRVRIGRGGNATGAVIPIPPQVEDTTSKLGVGGSKDAKVEDVVKITYTDDGKTAFDKWLGSVQQHHARHKGTNNEGSQDIDTSATSNNESSKNKNDDEQAKTDDGSGSRPGDSRAANESIPQQAGSHRDYSTTGATITPSSHNFTFKQQPDFSTWPALLCTRRYMHGYTATALGNRHAPVLPAQSSPLSTFYSFATSGLSLQTVRTI